VARRGVEREGLVLRLEGLINLDGDRHVSLQDLDVELDRVGARVPPPPDLEEEGERRGSREASC
jgi:hypothetical protein